MSKHRITYKGMNTHEVLDRYYMGLFQVAGATLLRVLNDRMKNPSEEGIRLLEEAVDTAFMGHRFLEDFGTGKTYLSNSSRLLAEYLRNHPALKKQLKDVDSYCPPCIIEPDFLGTMNGKPLQNDLLETARSCVNYVKKQLGYHQPQDKRQNI